MNAECFATDPLLLAPRGARHYTSREKSCFLMPLAYDIFFRNRRRQFLDLLRSATNCNNYFAHEESKCVDCQYGNFITINDYEN